MALALLVCACTPDPADPSPETTWADTIYRNAEVYTLNPARPWAEALAIRSGKLLAVGVAPSAPDLDATQLAAWTQTARLVLNLHESITRY